MNALLVLLLLVALSLLPAFPLWWWTRKRGLVDGPLFLKSLCCGVAAALAALVARGLFPGAPPATRAGVLAQVFVRVALTEEAARLVALAVFFALARLPRATAGGSNAGGVNASPAVFAGAISGLGFAAVETSYFSLGSLGLAFLRAVTAGPLHAACAARVALAVQALAAPAAASPAPGSPAAGSPGLAGRLLRALALFAAAVLVHGVYDFMVRGPALFAALAVALALSSFFSALSNARSA